MKERKKERKKERMNERMKERKKVNNSKSVCKRERNKKKKIDLEIKNGRKKNKTKEVFYLLHRFFCSRTCFRFSNAIHCRRCSQKLGATFSWPGVRQTSYKTFCFNDSDG